MVITFQLFLYHVAHSHECFFSFPCISRTCVSCSVHIPNSVCVYIYISTFICYVNYYPSGPRAFMFVSNIFWYTLACCWEVLKSTTCLLIQCVVEKYSKTDPTHLALLVLYGKRREYLDLCTPLCILCISRLGSPFFFPMQIFRCKRVWDYQLIRRCSFSLVKEHFKLCDMVVICILDSDFGSFHVWQ